jgi:vancomycin permeability regulator SanA
MDRNLTSLLQSLQLYGGRINIMITTVKHIALKTASFITTLIRCLSSLLPLQQILRILDIRLYLPAIKRALSAILNFFRFLPILLPTSRALAFFLGTFTLTNLIGDIIHPGFDANLWWIDLRILPSWLSWLLFAVAGMGFLVFGVGKGQAHLRRITFAITLLLLLFSLINTIGYYHLRTSGVLYAAGRLPFSYLIALALVVIALGLQRPSAPLPRSGKSLFVLVLLICLTGFPLAQIYSFGTTDYRRPADVAVVLGAKAFSDETCSVTLADRVITGADLYHAGLVTKLIFSGGPNRGGGHEVEAMRRLAVRLGIPDADIILDKQGLNTHATAQNTTRMFPALGAHRVIAVSHFFHLARIKLSYRRAGQEVYTVPVAHPRMHPREYPFLIFRETVAFWVYYLLGK